MTSDPRELAAIIQASEAGGLGERMGVEWLEVSPERVVARIPVEGNTQPFGLLHGGASAVLAEGTGSVLANLHAGEGRYAVGIELSCSHHRSAREGFFLLSLFLPFFCCVLPFFFHSFIPPSLSLSLPPSLP
ncbi:MAG: PaaI family thioesterase, partial [Actinomycetota bacterium]